MTYIEYKDGYGDVSFLSYPLSSLINSMCGEGNYHLKEKNNNNKLLYYCIFVSYR